MDRLLSVMLMKVGVFDDIRDVNGMMCYEVSKIIIFDQFLFKKQYVKEDIYYIEFFDELDWLLNVGKKWN